MSSETSHRYLAGLATAIGLLITGCTSVPAAPPASVEKMYVYNCGKQEVSDLSPFTGRSEDKDKKKTFVVSCYLIVHKDGALVWDTGLTDALAQLPDGAQAGPYHVSLAKPLLTQLKETGYTPENIRYLGISHMHPDHAGNANAFAKSTIFLQAEEYEAAFGPDAQKLRFNPPGYSALKDAKVVKLHGDYDVFGDGSVIIKRTLGHTPGHQSLYVNLPKSGPVVLSGDLTHFEDNWEHKRVPAFNFDKAATRESLDTMDKFLKQTGAKLLIQHDAEQFETIPHAPTPYL